MRISAFFESPFFDFQTSAKSYWKPLVLRPGVFSVNVASATLCWKGRGSARNGDAGGSYGIGRCGRPKEGVGEIELAVDAEVREAEGTFLPSCSMTCFPAEFHSQHLSSPSIVPSFNGWSKSLQLYNSTRDR
jgi:hypothetical protein